MQENVNIPDSTITTNLSFRQLVLMNMQQLTNFPYIEKDFDALTDYELLSLVVKYLNDVIANQNEQNDSITRMYESFLALQTYVNNTKDTLEDAFNSLDVYVRNYFDNLDVQEEINNKLDEMLEDGVFEQIIEQFLQSTAIWCFNTVADMKAATNLTNGSNARTLGYYSINDGGGALYYITNTESLTDYQEELNSELYATLIDGDNKNIIKYGGIYGETTSENRTKNSNIIKYILDTYNSINLDRFETIEVSDFNYALKNNSYLNNIDLKCYSTLYNSVFYINGERADKIKIGKMNLSQDSESSYNYGLKLGDYLTTNFSPFLVIDDLTISNFDYPFMIFSWNASINRLQSYNCKYAGVLFGTSTNINSFYANNCENGVLMGMMIDENENIIINSRTYFIYSNINILNEDGPESQSYLIGIGYVNYVNINELGYENSNLNNIFYGCWTSAARLSIGNLFTNGQLIEKIYKKLESKSNLDYITINNIRGEYLTALTDKTNDCNLITNIKDTYLGNVKGFYTTENIMIPYSRVQRALINFGDIYKNGGGSTSDLNSFNTYNKAIGILNNNEVLNIKLRGSRTGSGSTTLENRQIILLARLSIGDADAYNAKKIFGETLINVVKDSYAAGGTITANTSNSIDNLTISVDNTGSLPILQITPPSPTSATQSLNYAYMIEFIGGAYTEVYKTTRN